MSGVFNRISFLGWFFILTCLCIGSCGETKKTETTVRGVLEGVTSGVMEHIIMRLLLATEFSPPNSPVVDCRYLDALSTRYGEEVPLGSGISEKRVKESSKRIKRHLILVRSRERERSLADEFFKEGYYSEAAFHYRNLLEYHLTENCPERKEVEKRIAICLRHLPEGIFSRVDDKGFKKRNGLRLFMRVGRKNMVPVEPERIGVSASALPYYLAAQVLRKYGGHKQAIEIYKDILSLFVRKGSIAELDIYAKLAFLYGFCGESEAEEYYNKVLDDFHRLPLEVVCSELQGSYHPPENYVGRSGGDQNTLFVPGVVYRGIERLHSLNEQKPFPTVRGWTYLRAIEKRREDFLAMYKIYMGQFLHLSSDGLSRVIRFANCCIYNGNFKEAFRVLRRVESLTQDAGVSFKILVYDVRILLNSASEQRFVRALRLIEDYIKEHPNTPFHQEVDFLKARVLLMAGRKREARDIFARLASDEGFEFAPDARLALSLIERKLLRVTIVRSLTTSEKLPIKLTLKNISKVRFRLMRIQGEPPILGDSEESAERRVWDFLNACKDKNMDVVSETEVEFKSKRFAEPETFDYNLPIPKEGLFIVEAEGGGVSCRFVAIRSAVRVTVASLPHSNILMAKDGDGRPLGGVKLFTGKQFLGTTDSDGLLFIQKIPGPYCEICGGPCDFCDYCRRCWKKRTEGKYEAPPLIVTGVGRERIFRIEGPYTPVKVTETSKRGVLLYLYTDRPVYRVGDTLKFCGILRLEKEWFGRCPESRFEVLAGERVRVEVKDKVTSSTLFSREFTTNRHGSFSGEYYIPETASRRKYTLAVTYGGITEEAEFSVRDFVKPDYAVKMVPVRGGFRVFAGYSWGEPVTGAKIIFCKQKEEGEREPDGKGEIFIPAEDGEVVVVALIRDGKELVRKEATFHSPVELPGRRAEETTAEEGREERGAEGEEEKTAEEKKVVERRPNFAVIPDREVYYRGDRIRLKLVCRPFNRWEAVVVLGDEYGYDCAFVTSNSETATVEFPVRGAYDPATFVWVRFSSKGREHIEKRKLRICSRLLNLKIIPERREYEPSERTTVTVKVTDAMGRPVVAETSLAVVDEAIFTMAEDRTPDIYRFFYKERKGNCSFYDLEEPSFSGEDVLVESEPNRANWRYFNIRLAAFLFAEKSVVECPIVELDEEKPITRKVPRGTSFDNLSNKNLSSKTVIDAYGIGGGRAGAFGAGWGKGSLVREGGSPGTESAVMASCPWLWRHQNRNGSWDCDDFKKRCSRGRCDGAGMSEYDVMVTSLATLAFLEHGNTHRIGNFRKTVKKALKWLMEQQQDDGSIGRNSGKFWMLNHTTATMALCEAYAMTQDTWLRAPIEEAVTFLLRAKNAGSGWGFEPKDGNPNSLITGWATFALKMAKSAGISIPQKAFRDIIAFFDSVTDLRGWTYFSKRGEPDPDFLDNGDDFDTLPEWTAVAAICRMFSGQSRNHPKVRRAVNILLRHLPQRDDQKRRVNFHYWFFGTYALFQCGSIQWKRWSTAMKETVLKTQRRMGCPDGSWDPVGRWGRLYGRVGTTALGSLMLELYYRYARASARGLDYEEPKIRLYFPDTVLWAPHLLTDRNGEASLSFKLPDTITSMRLTARAVTEDTSVGEAVEWVEIKKDFFIKLKTPKFFVCGDTATIYANVYNYTQTQQRVTLELNGSGFRLLSEKTPTLLVPNDGTPRRVYWTVRITSKQSVRFTVSAEAGDFSDAVQLTIPVKLVGVEMTESLNAPLKRSDALLIRIPEEAVSETASVELVVRPTKSSLYYILETLRYLVGYPYG